MVLKNAFFSPIDAMVIHEVDAGTEITCPETGRTETVTEGSVVFKGGHIYCTSIIYAALKRAVRPMTVFSPDTLARRWQVTPKTTEVEQ